MEGDSTSILPLNNDQEDDLPIICPEFSIWDVGIDHTFNQPDSPEPHCGKRLQLPGKCQEINEDANQKKIMHREIERQRRREMASLYASLRSVLPPHDIKGKKSISDQIHMATKYVRCLQNNIKQLEIKREGLKKSRENEDLDSGKGSSSKMSLPLVVTVQPCSVGVEALISGDFTALGPTLPLSSILQLLLQEGLNVVSFNCTEFDGRVHYMIQSEVRTCPGVNLKMLETKLISMMYSLTDKKQ